MLDQITVLILTYNEAPNIGRTLENLSWARDIVVVDSFSDDATVEIVSSRPQARVYQRVFDTHENQWNFGLKETGIITEWVLALDADYVLTSDLVNELNQMKLPDDVKACRAKFIYCINGRQLRSGLYPMVTVLYRRAGASYVQDGHTQRVAIDGTVITLECPLLHDDRKPLRQWFQAQQRYTRLEANKLLATPASELSLNDRVRRWRVVAPVAVLFYCLIIRGGIFDGWPGLYYAFQRMMAELMLSLYLLEYDLGRRPLVTRKEPSTAEAASEFADVNQRL
jgi:glycosyltransferase involved in cell wall biosynthesis